jgi:2-polyprenyl-6-hydroxyphenyl methylase/3-demethylubiquinone-9 3-methyltransferase
MKASPDLQKQADRPAGSSPPGDPAEIAKFEAAAHRFWDLDGEFKPLHKLNPVRARYVQERCTLAGAQVLDVGCGGGLLAESLARAGARVTAIDLAPTMVETARLHALDSGLEIDYRVDSAEMLAAAHAGRFDVLTCMEMLEHVPDPEATVAVFARLVRTNVYDGLLTPWEIARWARAAGLDVVDIAGLKYDPVREQCSLTSDPSVNYLMHLRRRTTHS